MKRKNNPNISSLSLRSSSSRRSRKLTSTTTTNFSSKSSHNDKRVVGNSSKKSIFCRGCKNTFKIYNSTATFLNNHVKSNDKCPEFYPKCNGCGKLFYEDTHLSSHQSRSAKNSSCHQEFIRMKINSKFSSSAVEMIPIKKQAALEPSDSIPSHLQPLLSVEKGLMVSKQKCDYSSFQPTVKFQNLNIHNVISKAPSHFLGHAIMDPKSLATRKDVSSHGIYGTKSNVLPASSYLPNIDQTQVIDFGDFVDELKSSCNGINSDISASSINSSRNSSNSSSDDDKSSVMLNKEQQYSNTLMKSIIEDEDDNNSIHSIVSASSDYPRNGDGLHEDGVSRSNTFHSSDALLCHQTNDSPEQESIDIRNTDHFNNMSKLQSMEVSDNICDKDYKDCLELVSILMKYNIPLNGIYQELLKWKNKNGKLTSSAMTIPSLLSKANVRVYGPSLASKLTPIKTNLTCPSGRRVTVTSFDIDALIFDMLSDSKLMQHNNLVFTDGNSENPFLIKNSESYGDSHTSEYYTQTLKMKNINQETDLLVPIQLYMDETTLDSYSKLSLHPLVMTLLIFNRRTRNLSMSWRTLAYIPNFDAIFQHKNYSVDTKYNDFHFCLRYLLNGIEKLQSVSDGYVWNFVFDKYGDKVYKRQLRFVLGNVLGDAKGANVLCSRFNNNTTSHIARDCDVLTVNCDNPYHKCTFHKQKELIMLTNEELKSLSFRKITPYNAFSGIDFGANCYGINGACAADPCHMFNKGVVERLPKIFMARLPPKLVLTLDRHVGALVTNYGNQSDRSFPNIKVFSKGVSSSAKLRSDQHIARVLVIYLVLLTPEFEELVVNMKGRKETVDVERTRITIDEYNQWIFIFEETLILHSWIYLDSHPKVFFIGGKNSIVCDRLRSYMETYQQCAFRKEGMGLKFLKFHQILHLWWIIRLWGSLYNVDTARCESHHKKKKGIGRQTQRRVELFDEQTSEGEYKYNLFIKAIQKAGIPLPKLFEVPDSKSFTTFNNNTNEINNIEAEEGCSSFGSKFLLTFDYDGNTLSARWLSPKMKSKSPEFPSHILDGIFQKFKNYNHGSIGKRIKTIQGFTEFQIHSDYQNNHESEPYGDCPINHIVRACPSYRGEKNWFDWVTVNWETYGNLECQCLLFIDFSSIELEEYDIKAYHNEGAHQEHEKFASGKAALIHSIEYASIPSYVRMAKRKSFPKDKQWNTESQESHLVRNKLVRFCTMEKSYHIISIDNICDTSFVIPYEHVSKDEAYLVGRSQSVMVLMSMKKWNKYFID